MSRPGHDAVLLVTGFPSPYARRMVRLVLSAEPGSFVYVVVPAAGAEQAQTERDALDARERARLVIVEGDPSAMDLGLSGAEFRQIARELDRIHHITHVAAGSVDRDTAHQVNVVGAAEILELARAASGLKCLVFHSTAHVSGDRTGVVYEDDLSWGQSFRSEVEETRMTAETLARRAMGEVPVAVVRPTTLVGDFDSTSSRSTSWCGPPTPSAAPPAPPGARSTSPTRTPSRPAASPSSWPAPAASAPPAATSPPAWPRRCSARPASSASYAAPARSSSSSPPPSATTPATPT
jgi:hypothetical protein